MSKELKHYGTPQRFAGDPKGSGRYRKETIHINIIYHNH